MSFSVNYLCFFRNTSITRIDTNDRVITNLLTLMTPRSAFHPPSQTFGFLLLFLFFAFSSFSLLFAAAVNHQSRRFSCSYSHL